MHCLNIITIASTYYIVFKHNSFSSNESFYVKCVLFPCHSISYEYHKYSVIESVTCMSTGDIQQFAIRTFNIDWEAYTIA